MDSQPTTSSLKKPTRPYKPGDELNPTAEFYAPYEDRQMFYKFTDSKGKLIFNSKDGMSYWSDLCDARVHIPAEHQPAYQPYTLETVPLDSFWRRKKGETWYHLDVVTLSGIGFGYGFSSQSYDYDRLLDNCERLDPITRLPVPAGELQPNGL